MTDFPISDKTEEKINRLSALLGKEKQEIIRDALKFKLRTLNEKIEGGDNHATVSIQ